MENRAPEPENLEESYRAPAALFWGNDLAVVRGFSSDPSLPPAPVAEALQRLLGPA